MCHGESTYGPVQVTGHRVRQSELPLPEAPDMKLLADADHGTEVHCQHLIRRSRWRLGPYRFR